MMRGLYPGDVVLVNTYAYGWRLPITLLSIPFTDSYADWLQLPYMRLPAISDVERGDLLLFNYPARHDPPVDHKNLMAGRCVALPGDTLIVKDKLLYINGKENKYGSEQYRYRVSVRKGASIQELSNTYGISEGVALSGKGLFEMIMDPKTARLMEKDSLVRSLRIVSNPANARGKEMFADYERIIWNPDHLGPIIVPGNDMCIELDMRNIHIYKEAISRYEMQELDILEDKIMINGLESVRYTFTMDYYFIMDDNRDNAKDSRYWGFMPEDHLYGRMDRVLWSYGKKANGETGIRWQRIWKGL